MKPTPGQKINLVMRELMHRHSRVPTKPRDIRRLAAEIAFMARQLNDEATELHDVCYSRLPGPDSERVRVNGSKPTEDQALHGGRVKHHYNRACAKILSAHVELTAALEAFHQVIGEADLGEDFRDPEASYSRRIDLANAGWQVSPRELAEAREAQRRRAG